MKNRRALWRGRAEPQSAVEKACRTAERCGEGVQNRGAQRRRDKKHQSASAEKEREQAGVVFVLPPPVLFCWFMK
ncbi:hypothetical protein B6K86_01890 [Lachnospiraceae bacterium]|nr:hypothetical protein B6K86_01890 [Lachnospiraceae bacterium]